MPHNFLSSDFDDLKNHLIKESLITKNWDTQKIKALEEIHKVVYSFSLWDYNTPKPTSDNQKIFLNEIRSDTIQSIPLVLMGYKKPTLLLLRSTLENSLKHIYFFDHPVEFTWLTSPSKEKYFVSMDSLYEYIKSHPSLDKVNEVDLIPKFKTEYSEISKYIHSRHRAYMQLKKSLSGICFDEQFFIDYSKKLKTLGSDINFLFVLFHKSRFEKFDYTHRDLIMETMNKEYKRVFAGIA